MESIIQNGITYKYCYVKTRGTPWANGYYPENSLIEAKASKKKPTERKQLEKTCIELWSKIIHEKFNETCQMCGKSTSKMDAHHILLKGSFPHYKFDTTNGILLCYDCHRNAEKAPHNSFSNQPFWKWFEAKYPEWFRDIMIKKISKTKKNDMKLVYMYLKNWNERNNETCMEDIQ